MTLVILIIILALFEYTYFSFQVGAARGKYGVKAPATSGHPEFDKVFRVQQNTLEQLVLFIPALVSFAWMAESVGWPGNYVASGFGLIWLIGRLIYAASYVRDPATRTVGFLMTFAPTFAMMISTLVLVLMSLV